MNLVRVGVDGGQIGRELRGHANLLGEGLPKHRGDLAENRVRVGRLERRPALAGERQKLADDRGRALDGFLDGHGALRAAAGVLGALREAQLGRDDVQEVVEVVRDSPGKPPDRVQLLDLPELILETHPLGDVPQVALHDGALSDVVRVGDRLDDHAPAVHGLQRHLGLEGETVRLRGAKALPGQGRILEETDLPGLPADELIPRIAQQLDQIGIGVEDLTGRSIQDPDALARGLEDPPITRFRGAQRHLGGLALGNVVDDEENQRLRPRLARQSESPRIEKQRLALGLLEVDFVVLKGCLSSDLLQSLSQMGVPVLEIPGLQKVLAPGHVRRGREHSVEGKVGGSDSQVAVQDDQRLAHSDVGSRQETEEPAILPVRLGVSALSGAGTLGRRLGRATSALDPDSRWTCHGVSLPAWQAPAVLLIPRATPSTR